MIRTAPLLLLVLPTPLAAQSVSPGNWDLTSTAVDLVIPGKPGFLLRMMRGRSKTEHKCIAPSQAHAGGEALFAPDPKSKCTLVRSRIADGRIDQLLSCPQKNGQPMRVERTGTYANGVFSARLTMTGDTPKGAMRVLIDQKASHTGAKCR